jgi:hypothetical protein
MKVDSSICPGRARLAQAQGRRFMGFDAVLAPRRDQVSRSVEEFGGWRRFAALSSITERIEQSHLVAYTS